MKKIVDKHLKKQNGLLEDKDIFLIIEELRGLIEMNIELGYIEDIKEDILNLSLLREDGFNKIVKMEDLKNKKNKVSDITYRFLEMIEEQGLVLVLEPNDNIYIDVNYDALLNVVKDKSTLTFANVFAMLDLLQNESYLDKDGYLNKDKFYKMYKQVLVTTDFEKDCVRYKYLENILSYMEKLKRVYNEK